VEAGTEGATISTDNWLRGLMANMLMTDARLPDNPCGYRPGSQGGHWSESYIDNGPQVVGTLMRTVEPQARVQDVVNLLKQYAQITLQRLVARGAALAVDVDAFYEGSNIFRIDATITGVDNQQTNVSVSGARLSNSWVWEQ
jgi:phage gp46-like protein